MIVHSVEGDWCAHRPVLLLKSRFSSFDYTIHRRPYINITESRDTHSSTLVSRLKLPAQTFCLCNA